MEAAFFLYNLGLIPATILSFPIQFGFRKEMQSSCSVWYWHGRFGLYTNAISSRLRNLSRPRIWFQAVSIGEVKVARGIISELQKLSPQTSIVLSVTTKNGLSVARKEIPSSIPIIPYPLDLPNLVKRALDIVDPDVYVCIETEIWPNMVFLTHRGRIPIILINGRISSQSFKNYRYIRWFWRSVLKKFSKFSMISEKDGKRIISLGASPDRVEIIGNSKLSQIFDTPNIGEEKKWREILKLSTDDLVIVGGSLRQEENIWLLEVFYELRKEYPGLIGIFAPRHLKRIPSSASWLNHKGIPFQNVSPIISGVEKRKAPVILVDILGELANLYSVATVTFCGGSLVSMGGHNILEPVRWGKPVFYGPHMENFYEMKKFIEKLGLGFEIHGKEELLLAWKEALKHPDQYHKKTSPRKKDLVISDFGKKQAMKILEFIKSKG